MPIVQFLKRLPNCKKELDLSSFFIVNTYMPIPVSVVV